MYIYKIIIIIKLKPIKDDENGLLTIMRYIHYVTEIRSAVQGDSCGLGGGKLLFIVGVRTGEGGWSFVFKYNFHTLIRVPHGEYNPIPFSTDNLPNTQALFNCIYA